MPDPAEGYTAADFADHVRTEDSRYRSLFELLVGATGFEIEAVAFTGRIYGAYTCIRR